MFQKTTSYNRAKISNTPAARKNGERSWNGQNVSIFTDRERKLRIVPIQVPVDGAKAYIREKLHVPQEIKDAYNPNLDLRAYDFYKKNIGNLLTHEESSYLQAELVDAFYFREG